MRLVLTGGSGFIGSHMVLHWLAKHPDSQVLNIDKLTYSANPKYNDPVKNLPNYRHAKVDLAHRGNVREIIQHFRPDAVIHLAAESHVDNSITGPEPFVMSNVVGTFNLLEECRQAWQENLTDHRFLHVSTDEVYGALGPEGIFTEESRYAPNSPYSASKAGSDHLVRAYTETYGMNTVITHSSNNFGPHQHDEKLIPTVIRSALKHQPIPVYGKGENVRDWLYVKDHCEGICLAFEKGKRGQSYNIGGENEWQNLRLVRTLCDLLNEEVEKGPNGDYKTLIRFVKDRPGHDFRYALDGAKIKNELGWRQHPDFLTCLRDTVRWYIGKYGKS